MGYGATSYLVHFGGHHHNGVGILADPVVPYRHGTDDASAGQLIQEGMRCEQVVE